MNEREEHVSELAARLRALLAECTETGVILFQKHDERGEVLDAYTVLAVESGVQLERTVEWSGTGECWTVIGG